MNEKEHLLKILYVRRDEMRVKMDSEVGALKKQVESFVTDSMEHIEITLKHTASKEQLQECLRIKADRTDLTREMTMLKSLVCTKHDLGLVRMSTVCVRVQTCICECVDGQYPS